MLFEDTYKTIGKRSEGLFRDKGSRFIAFAIPCRTESEVKAELDRLRKEYYDARHQCYAYILGFDKSVWRTNDDGEPSGTAGKPIHGQLVSHDLTNTLVVVIRYFGGVKLGVRGLINAYRFAAQDALSNNSIVTRIIFEIYEVKFDYSLMNEVMRIMKEENLEQSGQDFQMECSLKFKVRRQHADKVVQRIKDLRNADIRWLKTV